MKKKLRITIPNSLSKHYAIHIFTLFAISIAHPLYDLLGQNDHITIFIAHQSKAIDIWLFVLLLSVLIPLSLCIIVWFLSKCSRIIGSVSFKFVFFALTTTLCSLLVKKYIPEPGNMGITITLLIAITVTVFYLTFENFRFFFTLMSPAVFLVPILFLTDPALKVFVINPKTQSGSTDLEFSKLPNIVIIIFDELPTISLFDSNMEIDGGRYPNFAKLAETSTWYRGASTIHYSTRFSIPSILTGTDHWERFGRLNINRPATMLAQESFPENIFSLLQNSHKTYALLSTTKIRGPKEESANYIPPLSERLPFLLNDLAIVYAHQISQKPLTGQLPQIYGQWQDFTGTQQVSHTDTKWKYKGGKPWRINQITEAFHKSNQPSLYVAHIVLPHHPFKYNEKGQLHQNKTRIGDDRVKIPRGRNLWPEEMIANRAYQAHLLQLGFVDQLLGHVIIRLEELDLFQDSLIVVTADHGISFYWDNENLSQADLYAAQASEILHIPLFIKTPGQTRSRISDELVQTIDILPTIAEMLEISIPWDVDGVSVLDNDLDRSKRFAWLPSSKKEFDKTIDPDFLALKRKIALFGSGSFSSIYNSGPHQGIIKTSVTDWPVRESSLKVMIREKEKFLGIDTTDSSLPAYIQGEIPVSSLKEVPSKLILAASVNGVIRGTTKISKDENALKFLVRVPPESFVQGDNDIQIFEILENETGVPIALAHYIQD